MVLDFWFFETGFLCVTVLAVQELALVDQAGLEFIVCFECLFEVKFFTIRCFDGT